MKTIKWQVNKSILLSKLPHLLAFTMNHTFSITDYGVCCLNDMLEELEANGAIIMDRLTMGSSQDVLISLPKHKQTRHEIEKMFNFAGEVSSQRGDGRCVDETYPFSSFRLWNSFVTYPTMRFYSRSLSSPTSTTLAITVGGATSGSRSWPSYSRLSKD